MTSEGIGTRIMEGKKRESEGGRMAKGKEKREEGNEDEGVSRVAAFF